MIRRQILRDVIHHPNDIANHISQIFSISRQAVNVHLRKLIDNNWLEASGTTRNRLYKLGSRRKNTITVDLKDTPSEHSIYMKDFLWVVEGVKKNIDDIIFYGFTEILNNAIDHSQGANCFVSIERDDKEIKIIIADDGEGIFKRITRLKSLSDEKQALLELYKGKLTTDPSNHSGQGIFFSSRMFDSFIIRSHDLTFSHRHDIELDVLMNVNLGEVTEVGTIVAMTIPLDSTRTDKEIFDKFSADEEGDYAFNRTIVPVAMARFDKENLISRSQAKRLLSRLENFQYVLFDFDGVESIGQAFSDEIFRVYHLRNPKINLSYTKANKAVESMIKRAQSEI